MTGTESIVSFAGADSPPPQAVRPNKVIIYIHLLIYIFIILMFMGEY